MLHQRRPSDEASPPPPAYAMEDLDALSEQQPLFEEDAPPARPAERQPVPATRTPATWLGRNQWVGLALASGACAAFNGVFAKLTTTDLTTHLSEAVARFVGLDAVEGYVEVVVRAFFFALNLVFNGIMWTLFTRALARGHSATQVSIMNTSANFVLTALLGFAIFSEALPPLWWLGAAMLVAGNVIIGRKDETAPDDAADTRDTADTASADATTEAVVPLIDTETDTPGAASGRRTSRRLARGSSTSSESSDSD